MIFGIGVDVLSADRMRKTFERFGERIVERLLMPAEREQLKRTARVERFLAMRFAAKEAIVKAMGTGFAHGIWIRDVGIVQNAWGKPEVVYSERGEQVRRKLGIGEGHVTLTDEAGLVVAVAVLLNAVAAPRSAKPRAQAKRKMKAKTKSKIKRKIPRHAKRARTASKRAR
jgi:holo-[acyl-carrier protein] synthase